MPKRIFALLLCAVMLVSCFTGCSSGKNGVEEDPGAYITMYLTDEIYDFDPANAYYNKDALNVVSMMYDTLFRLNENGKVKNSLVKKYSIKEDQKTGEITMDVYLREAYWSNGVRLSSNDVLFAFQRLVKSSNDYAAASLLYDIKNARAIKEGDASVDDIGIEAEGVNFFRVTFEGAVDYDRFLLNLTSAVTAPLLESYVKSDEDWAKASSTMVTNGAFKLGKIVYDVDPDHPKQVTDDRAWQEITADGKGTGVYNYLTTKNNIVKKISYFILERNNYYYRDIEDDKLTKSVTPYRLIVDCSKSDEDLLAEYKSGKLFYIGDIPLSLRNDKYVQDNAKVTDSLSTFTCFMNQNAEINGEKLFANPIVRKALSMAIDREAIAKEIVYAKAATGLVPNGIFNEKTASKKDFREVGGDLITASTVDDAKALLEENKIRASSYSFTVKVFGYDEIHVKMAEMIVEAWTALEFNVTLEKVYPIQNNDYSADIEEIPTNTCDDLFVEAFHRNNYEVILMDYVAYSADAYSMLSNFAAQFSGMSLDMDKLIQGINTTGYNSEAYNDLMEAIFYLPYFAGLDRETDESFLNIYQDEDGNFNKAEFQATYDKVKAVYEKYNITPSTKSGDWSKQKSELLHEAEKILVEDMPVIPVVFNQNAVLVSKDLSKTGTNNYYCPSYFRKTKLKNYLDYTPVLEEYPEVFWDKKGKK